MPAAPRPDVFNKQAFQNALRSQRCPESFVSPITSDFRLFVPLALAELGQDRLFKLANEARAEYGLGEQDEAWRLAAKHIVEWAENSLRAYKEQRSATNEQRSST